MYIAIRRISTNEDSADYAFGEDESRMGRLSLNLETGTATLLEACPDDSSEGIYQRAARKLFLHWQKGESPETTCWAT